MNNDAIDVDAQITQYTIYITDINTGNTIKENVTETQFTFNFQDDDLCPMYMYRVSAWNAGGEGELSEPVLESTPRGKESLNSQASAFLPAFSLTFFSCTITVPPSIIAENVSVAVTEESNGLLNIHIDVSLFI